MSRMMTDGRRAVTSHKPRPDYLRVVPEPGPVTPATLCPPWCTVEHDDPTDTFHYGAGIDAGPVTVSPEIDDDGSLTARVGLNGIDGAHLDLTQVDELIAALTAVSATLTGQAVAA